MLPREVLSNVHISIPPFVESCFGPGPAGPDPDQTVSRVIGPTEHMPQKYLILGKESPRDAHRIARSQTLFKRQGASEGVSRRHVVTCRGSPPPRFRPVRGRASSRLQRTQAAGKCLQTQIQVNSIPHTELAPTKT